MGAITTDYLVIGAGAAGMAFTDALITDSDAEVVMVERRHRPGGHWNDAYPSVRLHQPAAYYGVNSMTLGSDAIDEVGPNAGFYERCTAAEICDYFNRVLNERLLPSGRVRFFGMHDYVGTDHGTHQLVSRLTGETTTVEVRRRVVDATYLETPIPSRHTPPFGVDDGVNFIPVNGLVELDEPGTGFTVIGGGKTGMDACNWLLDNGVPPDSIRWIRPRDSWILPRQFAQPLALLPYLVEGVSLSLESAAQAEGVDDLFARLEACGQLVRIDPDVTPSMYRCATISDLELEALRTVENVVRMGRVQHIGSHRIELDRGTIPTDPGQVHVDCTAAGLRVSPGKPIFEPGRITLQQVRTCQPTFNAALVAFVETLDDDDGEKNRLCPPNPYPDAATDWISGALVQFSALGGWMQRREIVEWRERSRLDAARGIGEHLGDPRMQSALERFAANTEPALRNLAALQEQVRAG